MVATLFVCVVLPLRLITFRPSVDLRLTDSGREGGALEDMEDIDMDISEGMRPPSTSVGRRERDWGESACGMPPYRDKVWL